MVKEEHGDSADSISAEPMAVKAVMEFYKTDCPQRVMVTSICAPVNRSSCKDRH